MSSGRCDCEQNTILQHECEKAWLFVRDTAKSFRTLAASGTNSESAMNQWIEKATKLFDMKFRGHLPTERHEKIRQMLHNRLISRLTLIRDSRYQDNQGQRSRGFVNQPPREEQHQGNGITSVYNPSFRNNKEKYTHSGENIDPLENVVGGLDEEDGLINLNLPQPGLEGFMFIS